MTIRRVRIYQFRDVGRPRWEGQPFHLRAATALEIARCLHYGGHGVFNTEEDHMIIDQPFHNDRPGECQWNSPRYMAITTDKSDAEFHEIEDTLHRESDRREVAFVLVGEGEFDIGAGRWIDFRNLA